MGGTVSEVRAAVLEQVETELAITSCLLDRPAAGEVHLRLRASGICHSDLNFIEGRKPYPLPVVMGHEAAGTVVSVGEGVRRVRPGDSVVVSMTPSCGVCANCVRGRGALCTTVPNRMAGTMPDGTHRLHREDGEPINHFIWLSTFAEEVVVPEITCVRVRDDAPLVTGCLIGCGVTTGVMSALRVAPIESGDRVVVVGCGGVGLAAVMGAALTGAREILAVDPVASKVDLALSVGATSGLVATAGDAAAELSSSARLADVVLEATGNLGVMHAALDMCCDGGAVVIVGVAPDPEAKLAVPYSWLRRNRRLLGSHMGAAQIHRDIPNLIDLHLAGRLPIEAIISRTIGLSEINTAIQDMGQGTVARAVIDFDRER